MEGIRNHPPFMNGLLTARKILVSLRQKKIGDLKENRTISAPPLSSIIQPPIDKQKIQVLQESIQEKSRIKLTQKQQLFEKINKIGEQLYELNQQNQVYETIFNRLVDYYQENHKIVEDSEHLKRKSYQLEEKIVQYKNKIKQNYEKIQLSHLQNLEMQVIAQKGLEQFLTKQKERSLVEPLSKLNHSFHNDSVKISIQDSEVSNKGISLNWKALAQKSIKKAPVRKVKYNQQNELRDNMYNSQLYNL